MFQALLTIWPWLVAMALLIGLSAFYSACEAALFYLTFSDRQRLEEQSPAGRAAVRLLQNPDRLLSGVLFFNLVVNITYFAIASIAGSQLDAADGLSSEGPVIFALAALLTIIFTSEMVPKSIAVLAAPRIARLVSWPLAFSLRLIDPIMPVLQTVNLLSRRVIWPRFQPEPHLEVADLERALAISTGDAHLGEHECGVLNQVVLLSDLRADECMRPRRHTEWFRPPISLAQLQQRIPPSGYLLATEADRDEVTSGIRLAELQRLPTEQVEQVAEPVVFVPWCASAADALEEMQRLDREVAVVVNELGEMIGVLTLEDILQVVFSRHTTRSERLMNRSSIESLGENRWSVTGMTSLRRLARVLQIELPTTKSMTIAGALQESLQRVPEVGDECRWGSLLLKVEEVSSDDTMLVHLEHSPEGEAKA